MKYITPAQHHANRVTVHPSQRQHFVQPVSSPLYVVTAITNYPRFYARYRLFERFEKMCADAGAVLYTVEIALRDRHHEVTQYDNPRHVQLRAVSEIWHKENALNIAISRLPQDWEYVAWIDSDIEFARPDWVEECKHQLQHYKVIQMWSHAQDLGPDGNHPGALYGPIHRQFQSFMYSYAQGVESAIYNPLPGRNYGAISNPGSSGGSGGAGRFHDAHLWHSGYAWAARRSAIADLGGLGDIAILGSGDHHMAAALVGRVNVTIHNGMQQSFKSYWSRWQSRADQYIKRNIGYMPGLILHNWHGKKANRGYIDRWKILVDNKYDWHEDVKYSPQGVLELTERNWRLRDQIRAYFRSRNEDSIDA